MNCFPTLNSKIEEIKNTTFEYKPKKKATNDPNKEIFTYIHSLYKQIDVLRHDKDMMFIKMEKMERAEKNRLQNNQ